jgi:hypothetical protein
MLTRHPKPFSIWRASIQRVQIVKPAAVMEDLLSTIFTVRRYVMVAVIVLAVVTLATMVLVFIAVRLP